VTLSISELKERVRSGNDKLLDAWEKGKRDGDIDRQLERIGNSWPKLSNLCLELEANGFNECLYDKPKCKTGDIEQFCFVCPRETIHWPDGKLL
jgi:hypothetical protein